MDPSTEPFEDFPNHLQALFHGEERPVLLRIYGYGYNDPIKDA
jgi:hypothetical protein